MTRTRPHQRRAAHASRRLRRATPLLLASLLSAAAASATSIAGLEGPFQCRSIPDILEGLRSAGIAVAYSEDLVSERMLVHAEPTASDPAALLEEIGASYGLGVRELRGGALSVVPRDTSSVRKLRRISSPLLAREDSYDALPEWLGRHDIGSSVVEIEFDERSTEPPAAVGSDADFILWRLPERLDSPSRAAFALKQQIVATGAKAPSAKMGLDGPPDVIDALLDAELAPYIDGYVFEDEPWIPESDRTGRPWWRTFLGSDQLLLKLLDGAARGAALVLLDDAEPPIEELLLLEAIRATGAGVLESQPVPQGDESVTARVFLDPRVGRYLIALYSNGQGERVGLELEPELEPRVIYPSGATAAASVYGRFVGMQLQGPHRYWLIELQKTQDVPSHQRTLVEDDVLIDPYEVVVRNQIFQRAEAEKVLSLDVMEYATITPRWRGGRRSTWEHRIFQRRNHLDEYLHLKVTHDGVQLPRNKMFKSVLGRPIERIELEPLTVENRKTYRYSFLGSDTVDGHATWKIGFEPVVGGRLVSGVIWIDQTTGAHRQIRARHHNIGVGILSGEYTTRYRWIPGPNGCHWDWDRRVGTETYEMLDFEGVAQIDYTRRAFRFNRADLEQEIRAAHESDVLIHVATPPEGHRWLLRGDDVRRKRGDVEYGGGVLREEDLPEATGGQTGSTMPVAFDGPGNGTATDGASGRAEPPAPSLPPQAPGLQGDALTEVLAGPWAFPSRSRVSVGYFGGTGGIESDIDLGINYRSLDFLGRGKRGKDPLYLWLGGFGENGQISLTDPHLFGSRWSLTGSLDLQLDPEQDSLFRLSEPTPGDEASVANLSLEAERRSVRFSFGRPLTGALSLRLKLGLHATDFYRGSGTDPSFVVPNSFGEVTLRTEVSWSPKLATFVLGAEFADRDDWRAWGLDGRQEPLDQWLRWDARATSALPIGSSQMLTGSLGLFGGEDLDRFSRLRLFEVDARVPGYSSSIGFDEGAHVALSYNFRIWKLPLRLRTDLADLRYEDHPLEPELVDQTLFGAQLNLNLHGPWQTDLLLGIGRGLWAEPERNEATSYWLIVSRRFGDG